MKTYKAFVVSELEDGSFSREIMLRDYSTLEGGDVVIKVAYSGVNYKDVLSAMGNKGVTRRYPHVPGIDAAGEVVGSKTTKFKIGDKVVVMGYDMGMNSDGGFAEMLSVPKEWVMPLPDGFTMEETMAIGTAGFTSGLGVSKLLQMGQKPELGPIIVSGATGGVGGYAVEMLSQLGFEVWASTGKMDKVDYLKNAGATKVISREEICDTSSKPLLRTAWAGAFDTVGGDTLSTLVRGCNKLGSVTTCGSISGSALNLSIFPFILNGVNLLGINSADTLMEQRVELWSNTLKQLKPKDLNKFCRVISLEEINNVIDEMSKGKNVGRVIIKMEN